MKKEIFFCFLLLTFSQMVSANLYYVHKDLSSCSDSYDTTQAQNYGTPWCNMTIAFTNMIGGDNICVGEGTYNEHLIYRQKTINSNITIYACNGSSPIFSSYVEEFYYPNSLWENQSTTEYTVFNTSYNVFSSAVYIYDDYGNKYISDRYMSWFYGRNFNRSLANNENDTILIRNTNPSFNPNNGGLYVTHIYETMLFDGNRGSGYIVISGLTFKNHRRGIRLLNQSNADVYNCTFYGGWSGVLIDGKNYSENITIRNNFLNGNWSKAWYQDITKNTYEETTAVQGENTVRNIFVYNNTFENCGGAIALYSYSPYQGMNSQVYNNLFYGGSQSQIEVERYCANSTYHNNKIILSQMGVSFGPSTCPVEYPCRFHDNVVDLLPTIHYAENDETLTYAGKYYRWDSTNYTLGTGVDGLNVTNWIFDHNVFRSDGYAFYGILGPIKQTDYRERSLHNTTWEFNIFDSKSKYAYYGTGEATQSVFYDYNAYNNDNEYPLFTRWNDDGDSTDFQTLYDALNSTNYDGTWDKHSLETKPLYYNITANDYRLINSSLICQIGGGIGCVTDDPITCNNWGSGKDKIIDTYHDCKISANQDIGSGKLILKNDYVMQVSSTIRVHGVELNGADLKISGKIRLNGEAI